MDLRTITLTFISDTHNQHEKTALSGGDILIHCGDATSRGTVAECLKFLSWFQKQPYKHKVFIPGNHDFHFEDSNHHSKQICEDHGIILLNDSEVTLEGIRIYGSPITPWFHSWAFNRYPGDNIQRHWDQIPPGIDVLVTHGPPKGILDLTNSKLNVGCYQLLQKVLEIKPKIHAFGHIHEGYGVLDQESIAFVNASILDENYKLVNSPITITLNK